MIAPVKEKYRIRFSYPKHANHSENSGTKTQLKRGNPDVFKCICGGVVKMVDVFEGGKLRHIARCLQCGDERRKPSDFFGSLT